MGTISSFFERLFNDQGDISDPVEIGNRRFSIELKIGEGAYGSIYVLEELQTQKRYAIKVFKKQKLIQDESKYRRLLAERDILTRIQNSFISNLLACDQDPYRLFMIMELSLGGDLLNKKAFHHRLPERAVVQVALSLAMGLRYLHENGLVHGDVKPANVLVDVDGYCRLCDFGLCGTPIPEGRFWGTVPYMAPEIVRKGTVSFASDMWSLGILLFELFWGVLPWDLDNFYPTTAVPPPEYTEKQRNCFLIESRITQVNRLLTPNIQDPKIPFTWGVHDYTWSENLADLVSQLTAANPQERPTCLQLLSHKIFENIDLAKFASKSLILSSFLRLRNEEYPFPLHLNFETEERIKHEVDAISTHDQARFFDSWNWARPLEESHPDFFGVRSLASLHSSKLFLNSDIIVSGREHVDRDSEEEDEAAPPPPRLLRLQPSSLPRPSSGSASSVPILLQQNDSSSRLSGSLQSIDSPQISDILVSPDTSEPSDTIFNDHEEDNDQEEIQV